MEHKMGVMAYVLMNLILLGIPLKLFGIEYVRVHFTWYAIGFVMPRYWKKFGGKKWITWIGLIGSPITAMFWMIIFDNHALNVIASFICALLIPLLAAKIIEHSKILSFLLVGKYPNKEVKNAFAEDRK